MNSRRQYSSGRIQRALIIILGVFTVILLLAMVLPRLNRPFGTLLATEAVAAQPKATAASTTATTTAKATPAAAKETKPTGWVFQPDPLDSVAISLREREQKIQQREQELGQAEARLNTLRKEIEQNLARSEEVLKSMQKMAGEADSTRNKELKQWVQIYTAMKPAQAGPVLAGLDPGFALQILAQMEPAKAGKILDNMPPQQAIALGQQLGLKHP